MAKMTEYIITPAPQVCFQMLYLFLKLQNKDKKMLNGHYLVFSTEKQELVISQKNPKEIIMVSLTWCTQPNSGLINVLIAELSPKCNSSAAFKESRTNVC